MKPIFILKTLKEKMLLFIEYLMQLLWIIKRPDRALKDIYLYYLED
jgi:hypothetical protein